MERLRLSLLECIFFTFNPYALLGMLIGVGFAFWNEIEGYGQILVFIAFGSGLYFAYKNNNQPTARSNIAHIFLNTFFTAELVSFIKNKNKSLTVLFSIVIISYWVYNLCVRCCRDEMDDEFIGIDQPSVLIDVSMDYDSIDNSMVENINCSICLDPLTSDIVMLECNHTYHENCIHEWLLQRRVCPLCMQVTT